MLYVFRYMKGFLRIRISGFSPERFMNLCSNHGIVLWDIFPGQCYYEMNISLSDFYRLKPVLRKTKTRVHILSKNGFPFVLVRWKSRKIFLSGFLFCFCLLIYLSTFIWAIELEGNEQLTREMLIDFLKESQITYGTKKKEIDIDSLEKKLRNEYAFITWASVKIEGTELTIAVKENDVKIGVSQEQTETADLISDTNGVIESIITRKGVPAVKQGQEVKEGDLLISGGIPIISDDQQVKNYQYVRADGDVYVKYSQSYTDSLSFSYQVKRYIGKSQNTYSFTAFGHTFDILKKPENGLYRCVSSHRQLKILDDFYLPFYMETKCYSKYELVEKQYTKEEASNILNKNLRDFCEDLEEKGVQILEKNVKIVWESEKASLKGNLVLTKKMDSYRPVQIEEQLITPEVTEVE